MSSPDLLRGLGVAGRCGDFCAWAPALPALPPARAGSPEQARAWGRFTRNFVVQATAAEWALVLLGELRAALRDTPAHLVFFQHDEVIVHTPAALAPQVAQAIEDSVTEAARMLFGPACPVRFPMQTAAVDTYADAK